MTDLDLALEAINEAYKDRVAGIFNILDQKYLAIDLDCKGDPARISEHRPLADKAAMAGFHRARLIRSTLLDLIDEAKE